MTYRHDIHTNICSIQHVKGDYENDGYCCYTQEVSAKFPFINVSIVPILISQSTYNLSWVLFPTYFALSCVRSSPSPQFYILFVYLLVLFTYFHSVTSQCYGVILWRWYLNCVCLRASCIFFFHVCVEVVCLLMLIKYKSCKSWIMNLWFCGNYYRFN